MARWLIEADCTLIRDTLQSDLPAALLAVSSARGDNVVTSEPPADYFFYDHSQAMRCPAIFIVGQSMDFRQSEKQSNHINARSKIIVSVVIEDTTQEYCVTKSWRYQAALHQVLDQAALTSADNAARLIVVVKSAEMSPIFTAKNPEQDTSSAFRREIYLECEVEHYENY